MLFNRLCSMADLFDNRFEGGDCFQWRARETVICVYRQFDNNLAYRKWSRPGGFEPPTYGLQIRCSTTELGRLPNSRDKNERS